MAARKVLCLVQQLAERPAPYLDRLRAAGFEVVHSGLGRPAREEDLIGLLPGVFATIAGGESYTERVFASAPGLKVVARFGVGYDQVDVAAATRHGVAVAMAFGGNHESVADGAIALMAAAASDLPNKHNKVVSGGWGSGFHTGLWKKTVGVIGLGRIGRAFARRCGRGFDMRVLAYDPMPDLAYAQDNGIELTDLETLLRASDFVSLHIPHISENEGFMDAPKLALMKASAILINTARGVLVNEDSLYQVLREGRIAGAALDVFRQEPPAGSPLLTLDNVIFLPHCSGMDDNGELGMATKCIDAILAYAAGRQPGTGYVLNPSVIPATFKPEQK